MANQDIKLQKTIISNNNSNTLYNKEFNKLAKSDIEIDQSRILDIYNTVFIIHLKQELIHILLLYKEYMIIYILL